MYRSKCKLLKKKSITQYVLVRKYLLKYHPRVPYLLKEDILNFHPRVSILKIKFHLKVLKQIIPRVHFKSENLKEKSKKTDGGVNRVNRVM